MNHIEAKINMKCNVLKGLIKALTPMEEFEREIIKAI